VRAALRALVARPLSDVPGRARVDEYRVALAADWDRALAALPLDDEPLDDNEEIVLRHVLDQCEGPFDQDEDALLAWVDILPDTAYDVLSHRYGNPHGEAR
jgi:hypothetical protein